MCASRFVYVRVCFVRVCACVHVCICVCVHNVCLCLCVCVYMHVCVCVMCVSCLVLSCSGGVCVVNSVWNEGGGKRAHTH